MPEVEFELSSGNEVSYNGTAMTNPAVLAEWSVNGEVATLALCDVRETRVGFSTPVWLVSTNLGDLNFCTLGVGVLSADKGSVSQVSDSLVFGMSDPAGELVVRWTGTQIRWGACLTNGRVIYSDPVGTSGGLP